jgi:ABC-type transport system involved in cytochrome c biogenesis permease component
MSSPWSIMLATLAKDIRLEWRSKDALNSMLFFFAAGGGDFQFFF